MTDQVVEYEGLKAPLWRSVEHCFKDLQADDLEEQDNWYKASKLIAKALRGLTSEKIEEAFDLGTGVAKFLYSVGSDIDAANEGIKSAGEATAFLVTDGAEEFVEEKVLKKLQKEAKIDSKQWNPLEKAIYRITKKACITIIPMLCKGAALGGLLSGPGVVALPLFVLGVIISYNIEEEELLKAKFNAWLSVRLIANLNRCREIAFQNLQARKGRETASTNKPHVDDEDVEFVATLLDGSGPRTLSQERLRVMSKLMAIRGFGNILKDDKDATICLYGYNKDVVSFLATVYVCTRRMQIPIPRSEEKATPLEWSPYEYSVFDASVRSAIALRDKDRADLEREWNIEEDKEDATINKPGTFLSDKTPSSRAK